MALSSSLHIGSIPIISSRDYYRTFSNTQHTGSILHSRNQCRIKLRRLSFHGRLYPSTLLIKCFSQKDSTRDEEFELERLFSNLNQATLKREPGSLTGSVLLVAGTTIGAGILAIPAVTQESGFLASAVICILCWIFMVVTGLLIAEVNVKTMCELGSGGVSLVSMAKRTLGNAGVQIACWSYIFIHYALLVAYVARSSDILTNFIGIPIWESAALFSLLLGGLCYFGSQRLIGAVNGVLVFGILTSFAALVVAASGNLHWDALLKANLAAIPRSIPIIALSFVYQNVVPVICTNLEGNLSKVRTAIVLGTAIPLGLFLLWNAVILGTITSLETSSDKITDPLLLLRSTNGVVGPIVELFSLLAIGTSYIGFVLGLADFLADCDHHRSFRHLTHCHTHPHAPPRATTQANATRHLQPTHEPYLSLPTRLFPWCSPLPRLAIYRVLKLPSGQNRPLPYLLTLIPPLVLSLVDPEIFFKALDFAGTYGVLVLFGILPAAMSWSDRYAGSSASSNLPLLVPGGKLTLSLVVGGAGYVILSEIVENFGHV